MSLADKILHFLFSDHRNPIYAKFVTDLDWYDVGSKRFTQIVKYTREKALTMRGKNRGKNQKSICPLKRRFHVWWGGGGGGGGGVSDFTFF